ISSDEAPQTYIVQLNSANNKDSHFAMINSCYNKNADNSLTAQSSDPNTIKDVSFDGFTAYIASLRPSEADSLSKRSDVKTVEQNSEASINAPYHYNYHDNYINYNYNYPDNKNHYNYPNNKKNHYNYLDNKKHYNLDNKNHYNYPDNKNHPNNKNQYNYPDNHNKYNYHNHATKTTKTHPTHTLTPAHNHCHGFKTQKSAPFNLDRIDQAKFPLDGEYNYPKSSGSGVNVYIIDTGIKTDHVEFGNRATRITWGVAKLVRLIAVKVFNAGGSGSFSDVIAGIAYVASQHKNSTNKNTVVNMSLGGGRNQAVNDAVKALTNMGIHVVVAAGNSAADSCSFSPASEPSAICVGATEDTSDAVTDFSNFGTCVNIFAPGRNIQSAWITSKNSTSILSGTSMATPHVTGTIALIIAKSGNLPPAQMKEALDNLATPDIIPVNTLKQSPNRFLRVPNCTHPKEDKKDYHNYF
ncbi:37271_t:CDS:2, partial [Gigaspora margarita]